MEENIAQKLNAAGMDVAGTIRRFSGNEDLYMKFLRQFPDDPSLPALLAAMDANDFKEAGAACHTLKGVAGNLGMTALFEASNTLLQSIRSEQYEEARTQLSGVRQAYEEVTALIAML